MSNVNSEKDLVLQILLVGQPELRENLSRPELRQFAPTDIRGFSPASRSTRGESLAYIRHRLQVAGRNEELFLPEAVEAMFVRTHGVPRLLISWPTMRWYMHLQMGCT